MLCRPGGGIFVMKPVNLHPRQVCVGCYLMTADDDVHVVYVCSY